MAVLKERCPSCGGTIIFFENASIGECDSCGMTYSLSDLQKIKEAISTEQFNTKESNCDLRETEYYESALDTSEVDVISLDELCKKAEMALESEQWQIANNFSEEILRRNPKFAKAYLYRLLSEHKVFKKEELANLEKPFDDSDNFRLLMRFADLYLKTEIENYSERVKKKYQAKILEDQYQALCRKLPIASMGKHYQDLADGFRDLGDYRDSKKLSVECLEKARSVVKKAWAKATIKRLLIGAVIFGLVFAIVITIILKKASYSSELFSVEVTDKINVDYDDDNVRVVFKLNINNDSTHNANYLEGYITVSDTEGNVLASATTWVSGVIASKNKNYYEISFDLERNGVGTRIWNTAFSDLVITYRITEIHFEDGTIREYTGKDVVVNKP